MKGNKNCPVTTSAAAFASAADDDAWTDAANALQAWPAALHWL